MSMFKVSFKYAVFCAVFLIALFVLGLSLGNSPFVDFFFHVLFFGIFIFFALKDFKINIYEGYLHFWQGMTIGFYLYTISALIFSIFLGIYLYIDSSVLMEYKQSTIAFLEPKKDIYTEQIGEDGFQTQLDSINAITLYDLWRISSIKKIIAGFFVTPVISIILRNKPKQ